MFFENRFGMLYLFFSLFVVLAFIIRTALLIKSLPVLDLTLWLLIKGTSNNYPFVTPRRRESSDIKSFWIPAFAGRTFLEVAIKVGGSKIPSMITDSNQACLAKMTGRRVNKEERSETPSEIV
jgi:hypothetical protein